jgi:hypothetical protein
MAVREEQGMDAKMMKAPYVEEGEGRMCGGEVRRG